MPRLAINYETACIYEIVCKDVNVTQRYVGSTTNLIKRRYTHKTCCNNEKCKAYGFYVYQFIRENGSFENWDVVLIEQVIDCKDKEHLHKRERYYIEEKQADLNKYIPLRTHKENIEKNKQYRELNKKKISQKQKEWYEKNKNKVSDKNKDYRENNKDYRENNKEYYDEYRKKYYQNNKELLKTKKINKKLIYII
jgi:hypothetical protein